MLTYRDGPNITQMRPAASKTAVDIAFRQTPDYLDYGVADLALARHISHRNGAHRDRGMGELERQHRGFPARRLETSH
jgi:hypothetical protein